MNGWPDNFSDDDKWQRAMRDRFLLPFYQTLGPYEFIDPTYRVADVHLADTLLWPSRSLCGLPIANPLTVEEKLVRWPGYHYDAYTLETDSCTVVGRLSDGWMKNGIADILAYGFYTGPDDNRLRLHLVPFYQLQKWFHALDPKTFALTITNQLNKTACRVVPVTLVRDAIGRCGLSVERHLLKTPAGRVSPEPDPTGTRGSHPTPLG